MRSKKQYTNATFTKRIDHEAGRHRPPRGGAEPEECRYCGSVHSAKRWISAEQAKMEGLLDEQTPKLVVCPACQEEREGIPRGYVYLKGAFLKAHYDEIQRLLNNEASRAQEDNPLARIMAVQPGSDDETIVTTTTEHLAERLGQAMEKAFSGHVRYDFSHENKLARVYWQRD